MVFSLQYQDTALILACRNNDLTTVSLLLKAGAYPNGSNDVNLIICSFTTLFSASFPLFYTQLGQTALLQAMRHKNLAMVRELVQANVDVNQIEQVMSVTLILSHYSTCV